MLRCRSCHNLGWIETQWRIYALNTNQCIFSALYFTLMCHSSPTILFFLKLPVMVALPQFVNRSVVTMRWVHYDVNVVKFLLFSIHLTYMKHLWQVVRVNTVWSVVHSNWSKVLFSPPHLFVFTHKLHLASSHVHAFCFFFFCYLFFLSLFLCGRLNDV